MRLGKRPKDAAAPADDPDVAAPEATAPNYGQAVVNSDAVEIPAEHPVFPAMPPAAAFEPPLAFASAPGPTAMPYPAAAEPVAVVAPGQQPEPVTPLAAAAETFASGHGPVPAPAWPEGVQEIAAQRPEAVVGAAFVGGILAALILRRLGN